MHSFNLTIILELSDPIRFLIFLIVCIGLFALLHYLNKNANKNVDKNDGKNDGNYTTSTQTTIKNGIEKTIITKVSGGIVEIKEYINGVEVNIGKISEKEKNNLLKTHQNKIGKLQKDAKSNKNERQFLKFMHFWEKDFKISRKEQQYSSNKNDINKALGLSLLRRIFKI